MIISFVLNFCNGKITRSARVEIVEFNQIYKLKNSYLKMEKREKSKSASVIITLLGLGVFIFLLSFLVNKNSALAEVLSLSHIVESIYGIAPRIIALILLFFIFKLLYLFVNKIFISRFKGIFLSHARFESIRKLIHFIWWAIYVIIALSLLVGNIGTLIASAGLIGLGLTFALQKPILNFVGWVTIIAKDIYNEGDRVKIGKVTGDVKEIQLMNTVIYSLLENSNVRSHKIVTVPNELVLVGEVENFTKDSNYIREELKISITYESDYKKAMNILDKVVSNLIKKNLKSYLKVKKNEQAEINQLLKSLIRKGKHLTEERANLDKENIDLKREIENLETLSEEFQPKIRLEMADSSLILIAQFLTPYYEVKKNRTEINTMFLDAIGKEKDIEVAYPHMELVYHGLQKKTKVREEKRTLKEKDK